MRMHRVCLCASVTDTFPETRVGLLLAVGLNNAIAWTEVSRALADLEDRVQRGVHTPFTENDPEVRGWHEVFRAFGTNPRKFRPSLDALSRRLSRSGALPRINPAVDAYNLVSLTFGVPAGAFDADTLGEIVAIRTSRAGDRFTPLGEPQTVESPNPAEVVYADGDRVLTRHWNYRDAEATKVTPTTVNALFCMDRARVESLSDERLNEAVEALADLVRPYARTLQQGFVSVRAPEMEFAW